MGKRESRKAGKRESRKVVKQESLTQIRVVIPRHERVAKRCYPNYFWYCFECLSISVLLKIRINFKKSYIVFLNTFLVVPFLQVRVFILLSKLITGKSLESGNHECRRF